MALISCPECGTKISDKATTCPYCGFISQNSSLPISVQDQYEVIPHFQYDIAEWKPTFEDHSILSFADNRKLFNFFGKFENIKICIPQLAEIIQEMSKKESYLVADIDNYIKDLIEKGVYHFSLDKSGEILPTIRDSKKIVKQVRLKNIEISPDVSQSIGHLYTQAALALILEEIETVRDAIREIHTEFQDDRLAMAESSKNKLTQALQIHDTRLRESKIQDAIGSATDAKYMLMKNFCRNLQSVLSFSQKNTLEMITDPKGVKETPGKASDAFQSLITITNMVQLECVGYSILGEYEAGKQCLVSFRDFIKNSKLDQRDTLLLLNGNIEKKQTAIVDEFSLIAQKITEYDETKELQDIAKFLIGGDEIEVQTNKEIE